MKDKSQEVNKEDHFNIPSEANSGKTCRIYGSGWEWERSDSGSFKEFTKQSKKWELNTAPEKKLRKDDNE